MDEFFKAIIEGTNPKYRKIPTDTYKYFSKSGVLSEKQANWLVACLKQKHFKELFIPNEIWDALQEHFGNVTTITPEEIIEEEITKCVMTILERLKDEL